MPVLGFAPVGTCPKLEEEMQKMLLSAVLEARLVVWFDNVKRHLSSESLEAFLTSQHFEGRVLGASKLFRGENHATVIVTANGCTMSPDMRRRCVFVELFLEEERPEDRKFLQKLEVPLLLERRPQILAALWGLVVAWDKAGRPAPSRSHASFPQWAEIIGGIVQAAGYACPLESPETESVDTDGQDMRLLIQALSRMEQPVSFEDLVAIARSKGLLERILPAEGELDARGRSTLGKLLARYNKRLVGGCRLTVEGRGHTRAFRIESLRTEQPNGEPTESFGEPNRNPSKSAHRNLSL